MKVFPVVHINDSNVFTAVREGERAFNMGADGVYLIDHFNCAKNKRPLFDAYYNLVDDSKDRYVGINILGLGPVGAMRALARTIGKSNGLIKPPSGLWVDDMREDGLDRSAAIELRDSSPTLKSVRLLGGIAFKYTGSYTEDPTMALYETEWLKDSVDVVVTSGASTGREPTVEKLIAMKQAAGDKPLAVASGVSVDNIQKYENIVNEIIVSSSIETFVGSGKFDKAKLQDLIEAAHSLAD